MGTYYQEEKNKRVERFWNTRIKTILSLVSKYSNLQYTEMGSSAHHRIKNTITGKFIDFWQTGTMRKINGEHCGMGYKDKIISKEIVKLASEIAY